MTKKKQPTEAAVRKIRRRTRRKFAPEEKVRIVLEGLRGVFGVFDTTRGRVPGNASGLAVVERQILGQCELGGERH